MQKIAVIGSGTMGNGIAHVFALNGFDTSVIDISQQALDGAKKKISGNLERQLAKGQISQLQADETIKNLSYFTSSEQGAADADLVIEAATENMAVKLEIFKSLDSICKPSAVLASNTSSISITAIAAATQRPAQVIGMHFMNPVPVMKLVEVIRGYATSNSTADQITDLSKKLGKVPVLVNDYPGFVANRILLPMINEAIIALFEGVGGVEEIDTVMKLGMAHPMGPLQLADFIGLDVCLSIMKVLHAGLGNPKYAPCPLLVNMVTAGYLGVKSGEGFYKYTSGSKDLVVSKMFAQPSFIS